MCLDNIYKCVFIVPPMNQLQSTMTVIGYIYTYICMYVYIYIYSIIRHRVGSCSTTPATIFLHCDLFCFQKGINKFIVTLKSTNNFKDSFLFF